MKSNNTHTPLANTVALLFSAMALSVSTSTLAKNDCVKIDAEGNLQIIGPLEPGPAPIAFGTINYTYPDSAQQAMVTAFLVAEPKYTDDGTIHLNIHVQHDFSTVDNMTWNLKMVLSPTDVPGKMRINEHNRVIDGNGIYADAIGRSTGHGSVSFATGQAHILGKGRLCGISSN